MAFNIAELVARFEVTGTQSTIRDITRVQAGFTRAGAAATEAGAGVDKATASLGRADKAAISAGASTSKLRIAALQLTAAEERYGAVLADTNASMAKVATTEATLIRAQQRYNVALAQSRAPLAGATSAMRDVEKAQVSLGETMVSTGKKITKYATLPVIAAAAVSVDQAVKFQKSMTLIQTAGGETAAKTAQISTGIKNIAQETGTTLDNLSSGIYVVAKAGAQKWSATEQLEVLKAAAQGAKAENVDLGTSVDALTSVMLGYGMSASQAVKAEDQIIRGSALSKTTMSEFAGSLANVVPLAASLGISFAQVAGAEATMTQHGETAQRSTDNLANLITNLAGQNSVASKAMQQLGINTVDLNKNLGQRGLTGTLAVVLNHIEKSSKDGMVVVSAFKQARNATADLDTELGAMSGTLKANSQAFADGKMSYRDYRTYVRDLGGEQYALGQNFMNTVTAAKGFNSMLKSGDASTRTLARTLQQALGGVTGMRTALMLTGPYAKQFASNVQQVAKASLDASADVLGWNKTQDTLAVKLDKAKASLQVLAVEIGDELMPALAAGASELEKLIGWFDGLSRTQKEVLGWSAGVLAALGPVLSIGGKLTMVGKGIGTFTAGASAQLAGLAGVSEATSLRVATSMRLTTAALTGAGVGLALGEITKNSGDTTQAVGALGAALTGAAIGLGAGGPWGAAIGFATGGLADLATGFLASGQAATTSSDEIQAAMKNEKATIDSLTASIKADNGALGDNVRANVAKTLQNNGAASAAKKLGINLTDLTSSALGNAAATDRVSTAILKYINLNITMQNQMQSPSSALEAKIKASETLAGLMNVEGGAVSNASKKYREYAELVGGTALAQLKLQDSMRATITTLSGEQSQLTHLGKIKVSPQVTAQIKGLQDKLATAKSQLTKLGQETPNPQVDANIAKLESHVAAAQAKIDGIEQRHPALLSVNVREAMANVKALARAIAALPASTRVKVGQRSTIARHASGGSVGDGLSVVGEDGFELLDKHGSNVRVVPHPAATAFMGAAANLPGYASGTAGYSQVFSTAGSRGLAGRVLFQEGDEIGKELVAGLDLHKSQLLVSTSSLVDSMASELKSAQSSVFEALKAAAEPGRPVGTAAQRRMTL